MADIRTLQADEIECRVGNVSRSGRGCSILLYKNSRVDMAILDEVFGAANWQRDHKELKGVIYCGVAVRMDGDWIWKWDAGVESNTEPQKGEASDSFKRACVNWGIGRELYTAPFIWIKDMSDDEWNSGKPRLDIHVAKIGYDDKRNITELVIVDRDGKERFTTRLGRKPRTEKKVETKPAPQPQTNAPAQPVKASAEQVATHVTIALYNAGKCRKIVDKLAQQYDAKLHIIPAEAQAIAFERFDWDADAWNAVINEAMYKATNA